MSHMYTHVYMHVKTHTQKHACTHMYTDTDIAMQTDTTTSHRIFSLLVVSFMSYTGLEN